MPKLSEKAPTRTTVSTATKGLREVVYPELKMTRLLGDSPLTADQAAKDFLKLQTEDEWIAEQVKDKNLTSSPEEAKKLGLKLDRWTFIDDGGEESRKVICWAVTHNRPVEMSAVKGIMQDILTRNWAGAIAMPGKTKYTYSGDGVTLKDGRALAKGDEIELDDCTINGETIVIDRSGQVIQGQKRLIALWLAREEWRRNPEKWKRYWPTEPVLETLIVYGVSDNPRVVQTIDNTQTRSEADTFYTTGIAGRILGVPDDRLPPKDKQILCKMLQAATDWAWERSGMSSGGRVRTNRAAQEFLDANPKILKSLAHIYKLNTNRSLSLLRLSVGTCAAAMWLQAQGKTDPAKWRGTDAPSEKQLDMTLWGKAEEFWTLLAEKQGPFKILADQIVALMSPEDEGEGLGGRSVEKFCTVARAWQLFVDGKKITKDALALEYGMDANGRTTIAEPPTFGGIDLGPKMSAPNGDPEVTPEEVEAKKAEVAAAKKTPSTNRKEEMDKVIADRKKLAADILADRAKRVAEGKPNGHKSSAAKTPAVTPAPAKPPQPKASEASANGTPAATPPAAVK